MGAILASVATALPNATPALAEVAPPSPYALTLADKHGGDVYDHVNHFPTYAGVRVTPDNSTIEVYVTRPEAALHAAAVAAAGGAPVKLTTVRHTYATLTALKDRVLRDRAWIEDHDIDLVYVAVRDEMNKVGVGIAGYTPEKAALIASRYPKGMVVVTPEGRAEQFYSRGYDTSPWNGGSFIYTSSGKYCSAGPAVKSSTGKEYILTAGHCYVSPGTTVSTYTRSTWQRYPGRADPPFMGNAKAENPAINTDGYDLAVISVDEGGGASALNFRTDPPTADGSGSPQKRTITGVIGTRLCMSGAYSGERCAAGVDIFNATFIPGKRAYQPHIIHANRLVRDDPAVSLAGQGDSGGPVYQVQSDGLAISGIILGGQANVDGDGDWTVKTPCWNDTELPGRICSSYMWFGGIGSILSHTGMSLLTL
ncbi:MAG TPA: hypothetical protein VF519_05460 [Mycobacteriales bacterium]